MKRTNWLFIILGLAAVIAVGWAIKGTSPSTEENNLFINPELGPFEVAVTTTGELRAKNSTEIKGPRGMQRARLYNVAISFLETEGTRVKEGQIVAKLDPSDLNNKIEDIRLELDKINAEYTQEKLDTALTLSEKRNEIVNLRFSMEEQMAEMEQSIYEAPATQQKVKLAYQKAKRAYLQAEENYQKQVAQAVAKVKQKESDLFQKRNELNEYEEILDGFTIEAPADGMIIYHREWNGKKKTVGSTISPWNPVVATLPDLSQMESITYVNEVDIRKILKGQEVTLGLDAMADKQLSGKVTSVANVGEQRPNYDSKVFEVIIEIEEQDTTLRPAMTTSNEIRIDAKDSVMFIPLECLHTQDSISFVFKKGGGNIVRQQVFPGLINENHAEILQGLDLKDELYLNMPAPRDTVGTKWVYIDPKGEKILSSNP